MLKLIYWKYISNKNNSNKGINFITVVLLLLLLLLCKVAVFYWDLQHVLHCTSNFKLVSLAHRMFTCLNILLPPSPPLSYTQKQTVTSGKYNRALCETLLMVRLVVDSCGTAADFFRDFPFESRQKNWINQHVFRGLFGSYRNTPGQYLEFGHDFFFFSRHYTP
jgi:hypothetical protein